MISADVSPVFGALMVITAVNSQNPNVVNATGLHCPLGHFIYPVPAQFLNHTKNLDCDTSWHKSDDTLLAVPSNKNTSLPYPVINMTEDSLTTTEHVERLKVKFRCLDSVGKLQEYQALYTGPICTTESPHISEEQKKWIFPVGVVIAILCLSGVAGILYFIYRRNVLEGHSNRNTAVFGFGGTGLCWNGRRGRGHVDDGEAMMMDRLNPADNPNPEETKPMNPDMDQNEQQTLSRG